MKDEKNLDRIARFAWFVLAWTIVVILWGVFLRASKSGDGCGRHWLTCNGEVVPSAPELKTVIEFSHRITSTLDGLLVVLLFVAASAVWYRTRTNTSRRTAALALGSLVFVIIEGLIGAGLVLTGNTAETLTPTRPAWAAAHLVNTLILLAFLTLTAWSMDRGRHRRLRFSGRSLSLILTGAASIILVGISGSIAALASMLFPSATIADGIAQDFSAASNVLIRLRVFHPLISIGASVFLFLLAGWFRRGADGDRAVTRWANVISVLILVQLAFGAATLLTLAPIVMQLGHLLLADAIWIAFVLMSINYLATQGADSRHDLRVSAQSSTAAL